VNQEGNDREKEELEATSCISMKKGKKKNTQSLKAV